MSQTEPATADLTELRVRLLQNGWTPIPVTAPDFAHPRVKKPGKQPFFSGWQTVSAETLTPETVAGWVHKIRNHTNTGILTGCLLCIDIDVPDQPIASETLTLATRVLGPGPLMRVGNAPKILCCYRREAALPKRETEEFFLPDGRKLQIEALGVGQQAVAFGIHPETGRPYTWLGDTPENTKLADLPLVSEEALTEFLEYATQLFRSHGALTQKEIDERKAHQQQSASKLNGSGGSSSFFANVNTAALASLGGWVPRIFPKAVYQSGTKAYRVRSADLGRDYEEDLSIHPNGIQDFGPRKGLSAIDVVMEFGGAPDVRAAAFTLCEWIGARPEDFGWHHEPEIMPLQNEAPTAEPQVNDTTATPSPSPVAGSPKKKQGSKPPNLLSLVTHIKMTPVWNDTLRFNLFTENYEVCPPFPPLAGAKEPQRPLADPLDILRATMYFQANGFPTANKGVVFDALATVAHEHSYHPVRDYLNSLQWDGTSRVSRLFQHYFNAKMPDGADPTELDHQVSYLEHTSTSFMVSAVARVMQPGCQADYVPVIVSHAQGMQKSTAIRKLCPDESWFTDNISADLIDRDTKESLRGKWLIELAEIPHIRRETERVKVFFSTRVDRYRAAYGKATQDHPRQCVCFGSSNDLEFVDPTGNRRFWPFLNGGMIDTAAIERDRDQLWAEAVHLYRQGVRWWLAPNIEKLAAEQQDAFAEGDLWDEIIAEWLTRHPGPFTMASLFAKDTGITPYREVAAVTRADEMRAGRCLTRLKFSSQRKRINGVRAHWWAER